MTPSDSERIRSNGAPILLTLGDPCGIGPEIVLKACCAPSLPQSLRERLVVVGDSRLLMREAARLALPLPARIDDDALPTPLPDDLRIGQIDARAGDAAVAFVSHAARRALAGEAAAVVTAPLAKAAMQAAGHPWPGHTELLAHIAGDVPVRMMLANDNLRTVLVSIHVALAKAITLVHTDAVLATIRITFDALRRAGIDAPRIAVAGLNPHAGEGGMFGREEIEQIAPAVARARDEGIDASGPWAPDTVFMRAREFRDFDVVVAMYHDQGLIPVKYMGLDDGVNITIGLPFVRTSPDHGTAFDIAGQPGPDGRGLADPASLIAAIRHADRLAGPTMRRPHPAQDVARG